MSEHVEVLSQWWENAEVPTRATLPKDGDRIIIRYNSEWYEIATADGDAEEGELSDDTRVLARAPKPKPAWHDAVAVIAHTAGWERRRVLTRHEGVTASGNTIWSCGDMNYAPAQLINPVPLIEARVTDEMVQRFRAEMDARHLWNNLSDDAAIALLAAALGVDE